MTDSNPTPAPEDVTQADVDAAEAAANAATALVAELEGRVIEGDETVTPDDITAQEGRSRFARLFVEGVRRRAEESKVARRLKALEGLREEIELYATGSGLEFATLLRAVKSAEEAFTSAVQNHNENVRGWYVKAERLGASVTDGRPMPPAEDGRLALGRKVGDLHVGRRWLSHVDEVQFLETSRTTSSPDALFSEIEAIDSEVPESNASYFYRGSGGAVIAMDHPANADEIANGALVQISRKDAWGE
ncbi:hypothetical protein B7R54_15130 [Subtercola boreus]|uniref:Uncharacterized protein n=1 Tax=Subtercola boreus TaxID=120213 RepID=A0A3E0VL65_9MICO|nr:hypothetical protein [Subtercola boreus]RFA10389.1 hypothetical protein B7R54_15130 [Subtercola boreus]TQL56093.1 hypothetical protein FB464_3675 [Subtercola boreus]